MGSDERSAAESTADLQFAAVKICIARSWHFRLGNAASTADELTEIARGTSSAGAVAGPASIAIVPRLTCVHVGRGEEVPCLLLNSAHYTMRMAPVYRSTRRAQSHIRPQTSDIELLEENVMLRGKTLVGLAAFGALALNAAPAAAQVQPNSQEVHAYGGELFGDDLTDMEISGRTPKLDDDLTYGIRYGYNFTSTWGIELSLGQSASSVTELASGDVDLDLSTVDVDAVWHFNSGSRFVPYAGRRLEILIVAR